MGGKWEVSGRGRSEAGLFAWRLLRNRSGLGCAPKRVDLWAVGEGPAAATPGGRYRLQPAAEAAREENAAHPEVVLALESLRTHQSCAAALIRSIEERVERHVAPDERGEPAKKTPDTIGTHLVKSWR